MRAEAGERDVGPGVLGEQAVDRIDVRPAETIEQLRRDQPAQNALPLAAGQRLRLEMLAQAGEDVERSLVFRSEVARHVINVGALASSEERVVSLTAEGLTNRQIAERLFIAPGTVKVHLGHVFTKLGVTTRAELASLATRRS